MFGWAGALAAGAVAVVCCALGPALVAGSVVGAAAGVLTGGGPVAVLAYTLIGLISVGGVLVLGNRARSGDA